MISIIVSSYKENIFKKFETSVKETIGVDYEIIKIHNPGMMGICEAYNKGIELAKNPYVCFSHDDIIFNTNNWGEILINDFNNDPETGLIGIAGSAYKPWVLSGWHSSRPKDNKFVAINVIHVSPEKATKHTTKNFDKNLFQVVNIDGCFMFSSKIVVDKIKFDESTFTKFHCYDIDFSLQVAQKYKVFVADNILLSHFSGGNFDKDWFSETIKLHKKWEKLLPFKVGEVSKLEIAEEEESAYYGIINALFINKIHYYQIINTFFSLSYVKLVGLKTWFRSAYKTYKIVKFYIEH